MTLHVRNTTDLTNTPARTRAQGIAAGTMILTARGEVAIEDLQVGDRLISRDRGMVALRAITRRPVEMIAPVRVRPDSLGLGRPDRDVILAPGQHVHVRDWRANALFGADAALVPAWRMTDGNFVAELPAAEHLFFELHFDGDHILYANGLEVGSGMSVDALVNQVA